MLAFWLFFFVQREPPLYRLWHDMSLRSVVGSESEGCHNQLQSGLGYMPTCNVVVTATWRSPPTYTHTLFSWTAQPNSLPCYRAKWSSLVSLLEPPHAWQHDSSATGHTTSITVLRRDTTNMLRAAAYFVPTRPYSSVFGTFHAAQSAQHVVPKNFVVGLYT